MRKVTLLVLTLLLVLPALIFAGGSTESSGEAMAVAADDTGKEQV